MTSGLERGPLSESARFPKGDVCLTAQAGAMDRVGLQSPTSYEAKELHCLCVFGEAWSNTLGVIHSPWSSTTSSSPS